MNTPKIVVLIMILMGFGFMLTAQRLESRNIDIRISELRSGIESVNSHKRELHLAIESEMQRLSMQDSYNASMPISVGDIVKVDLQSSNSSPSGTAAAADEQPLDRLVAWLSSARN